MIRILRWTSRYEPRVRENTRAPNDALHHFRVVVTAPGVSSDWITLANAAESADVLLSSYGLFFRLLEFIGAQPKDRRDGIIRDVQMTADDGEHRPIEGQPTFDWLSQRVLATPQKIAFMLLALAKARWIDITGRDAAYIEEATRQECPIPVITETTKNKVTWKTGGERAPKLRSMTVGEVALKVAALPHIGPCLRHNTAEYSAVHRREFLRLLTDMFPTEDGSYTLHAIYMRCQLISTKNEIADPMGELLRWAETSFGWVADLGPTG